jgi:hypothetical protein
MRALDIPQIALHIPKRALDIPQIALDIPKRALDIGVGFREKRGLLTSAGFRVSGLA